MSAFVLDCSVTVAWLFDDETTPETDALLDRLKDDRALVPMLWHLEIANVLARAQRHKRISGAQVAAHGNLLSRLPILTDAETQSRAFGEILAIAGTQRLSTYDAAYLELAMRRGMALATIDKALVRAARHVDVETLPAESAGRHAGL